MAKYFGIKPNSQNDIEDISFKKYFELWKKYNFNAKEPFTPIFLGFKESLKDLDGGALKLYLYFCLHSNNTEGHSWHSIQRIAEFFKKEPRTINSWIKILVSKGLIYRDKKGHVTNTTYLVPYSNFIVKINPTKTYDEDSQELLQELIEVVSGFGHAAGKIDRVYHLFQWKTEKDKRAVSENKNNVQYLVIVTKRENMTSTSHIYKLTNSEHMGVSELNIDTCCTFDSYFKYNGTNIPGFALNHQYPINKISGKALKEATVDIAQLTDEEIRKLPKIKYGDITTILEDEVDYEDEENDAGEENIEEEMEEE